MNKINININFRELKMKKLRIPLMSCLTVATLTSLVIGASIDTRYNLYTPPNNNYSQRKVFVSVTAMQGAAGDTTVVNIVDKADVDGDSDDSAVVYLTKGETYITFINENGTNDDKGGPTANLGDNFNVTSNRPVNVMTGTLSDWEYDFVPGYKKDDGGMDFYIWVPGGGHISYFGLDVFSYENNTDVVITDITNVPKMTSGKTSVNAGIVKTNVTLSEGEDLFIRNGVGNAPGYLEGGHTYHVSTSKGASVLFGGIRQDSRGRDGAAFVKDNEGLSVGDEFYFFIPGRLKEREAKFTSYSNALTYTLEGWNINTLTWDVIQNNVAMNAYDYAWFNAGTSNDDYGYFKLTSTEDISIMIASWLETGGFETSDIMSFITSKSGLASGTDFMTFIPYPANESSLFVDKTAHVYIYSSYNSTMVNVKDVFTNGANLDTTFYLDADETFDLAISQSLHNELNTLGSKPYVHITSDKVINAMVSNWNDNWLAFAAGALPELTCGDELCDVPDSTYMLIGVPKIPANPDVGDVFGDDFGGIGGAGQDWRVSRWDVDEDLYLRYGEPEQGGSELGDPPDVTPGFGYWAYQEYQNDICIDVVGAEVTQVGRYNVPLQGPNNGNLGINQMANPYAYPIDWKDTEVIVGANTYSVAQAAQLGIVNGYICTWNGDEYIPISSQFGGQVDCWQGFWLCVYDSVNACSLSFSPEPLNTIASPSPSAAAKAMFNKISSLDDWLLQISVSDPTNKIRDTYNAIGVSPLASDAFDAYDALDYSPPKSNFVLGFMRHNDSSDPSTYWADNAGVYTYDVKSPFTNANKEWKFEVYSWNNASTDFTLTFPNVMDLPEGVTISMTDEETGTIISDISTQPSYTYTTTPNGGAEIRTFTFSVDIVDDVEEGVNGFITYRLAQNYPNPFNPTTNIAYSIKKASDVKLTIYNLLGEEIKTLVQEFKQAGNYSIEWNGTNNNDKKVSSGVYFYKIESAEFTKTRKMILLK
ncbi:MAG: T9SS C-terminal target domain-containing protein [Calditrichaeota bacterium]|nr:MAG: T9SS C-terminal target domain-containing protein [Calditrichota bacterium]